ncbi:hypothetical protein DC030_14605 [Enterococcus faecalis]|nr:hypothetical protein DC030_14605 [Enterococcus faecalis]
MPAWLWHEICSRRKIVRVKGEFDGLVGLVGDDPGVVAGEGVVPDAAFDRLELFTAGGGKSVVERIDAVAGDQVAV